MVAPIKQVVTIQAGGLIQIRSASLRPGAQAEVTIVMKDSAEPPMTWESFIGSGKGQFKSAAEIERYIDEVRDWGDRDK